MEDLKEFFKDINRIANAIEKKNNLLERFLSVESTEARKSQGDVNNQVVNSTGISENVVPAQNPIQQSLPTAIPVSNTEISYTQEQIALAMGRALDDPAKMNRLQEILAEFGATCLMDVPADQYNNLVLKLKMIGVEV